MKDMKPYRLGEVLCYGFGDEFGKDVFAGMTTREGGVSTGIFASMNLSSTRGDDPKNVAENARRLAQALGVDRKNLVFPSQTHTTNIRTVDAQSLHAYQHGEEVFADVDGLATTMTGIVLLTTYADCVPLYFFDPIAGVVACAHAGRVGTFDNMAQAMLNYLSHHFGTHPSDVRAGTGPCISMPHYEVEWELAKACIDRYPNLDLLEKGAVKKTGETHGLLDLRAINGLQLLAGGVKRENLYQASQCTYEMDDVFFSHRKSQGKRGNMAGFIYKLERAE